MRPRRTPRTPDESLRVLLEELDALRLDIASDLIVAAAAAEAERLDIASEVVDADRGELAAFADWASRRLSEVPATPVRPRGARVGSMVAAASLTGILAVGAAAAAVHATGQHPTDHRATFANAQLAASYDYFQRAVTADASAQQVADAVRRLHLSLAPLIAAAANDPSSRLQVLDILRRETLFLEQHQPAGAARVLAAARALVARITGDNPAGVKHHRSKVTTPPLVVTSPDTSSGKNSSTTQTQPTPAPNTTPSPAPTPPADSKQPPPAAPSPAPTPPWPFGESGFAPSRV